MRKLLAVVVAVVGVAVLSGTALAALTSEISFSVKPAKGPAKAVSPAKGKHAKINFGIEMSGALDAASTASVGNLKEAVIKLNLATDKDALLSTTEEDIKAGSGDEGALIGSGKGLKITYGSLALEADINIYYGGGNKLLVQLTIPALGNLNVVGDGTFSITKTSTTIHISLLDVAAFLKAGSAGTVSAETNLIVSGTATFGSNSEDSPIVITQCGPSKQLTFEAYLVDTSGAKLGESLTKSTKCTQTKAKKAKKSKK